MALQGSLDTFALPDVLNLLATTNKTGGLHVVNGRISGSIWLGEGKVVAANSGRAKQTVDAVAELLRLSTGDFAFDTDDVADEPKDRFEVTEVLAKASAQVAEWLEIEKVVPSLDVQVKLVPEAPSTVVTLSAKQWEVVLAATSASNVDQIVDATGRSEFLVCKTVKELVEAGLASVEGVDLPADNGLGYVDDYVAGVAHVAEEAAAAAPAEEPESNDDSDGSPALERWAEIRRVAKEEGIVPTEEDMTDDEAEQVAEMIAAEGADPETPDALNRAQLLKFLSSVRS